MEYTIKHNLKSNKFETIVDGVSAFVEYESYSQGLELFHTLVPKEIGGRGIAAALVKFALEYAKENNFKIKPTCSYVKVYLERHKEQYGFLEDKIDSKFKPMDGMTGHACGTKKTN